jgi:hypothetical protein
MIAHVAEAGEDRGRVVLRLGSSGRLSDIALEAAVRVAQAFQSEIESLFIEDRQLFDLAGFPFAREISLSGRQSRPLSPEDIGREMQVLAAALHRKVLQTASVCDVPVRARVIRDEPVRALAKACAERGPWNVVTLAEPFTGSGIHSLTELFSEVQGTTGIILAGPKARHTKGPVVAIIEELDRVAPMLRAAERLATATGGEPRLLLVEEDSRRLEWMEGQVRLALGPVPAVKLEVADLAQRSAASIAQVLRGEGAGFVIVRFGGRLAAGERDLVPLVTLLEGPLFLVR